MLNNQKGFSLFSIIAAIVVMGFLSTIAITKMSDGISSVKQSAACIAGTRALNALEAQVYPAYIMEGNNASDDAAFFAYIVANYPDYVGPTHVATEIGTGYEWSSPTGPDITGGSLYFDDNGSQIICNITRTAGDNSQGIWTD